MSRNAANSTDCWRMFTPGEWCSMQEVQQYYGFCVKR
jgi:hypothetical protein